MRGMRVLKQKIIEIFKKSIKLIVIVLVVCMAYKLNIFSVILCVIAAAVFGYFYEKEEEKRLRLLDKFKDVVLYMEQMIYSFKKQPKIRPALRDAQKVGSKKIQEVLEEVVLSIDTKESEDIYMESLNLMNEEYGCKRLNSLHEFLVKIELHGGDYDNYVDILLQDVKDWNDRTRMFISNVNRVKRNVLISIVSTVVTCGFMAYLVPKDYSYTSNVIYQICTTIMILLMLAVHYLVERRLNYDWLKEAPTLNDNQVMRYYTLVERGYRDMKSLKWTERMAYKKAKKRLENELSKVFPDWIRDVAINLQNDTVQSSIENSYETAPFILKRPIRKLLLDFEKFPVGIEPYNRLLEEFDLDDVKSSMKMFYSINELGKEESDQQINSIIDRNNKLAGLAEEMKNSDRVGAANMFSTIPMVIGVVKIMVDMVLMILVFTQSIGNVLK